VIPSKPWPKHFFVPERDEAGEVFRRCQYYGWIVVGEEGAYTLPPCKSPGVKQ